MMVFGMRLIAEVWMALLVHKDQLATQGLLVRKVLQEQLERKDQLGHKVPWVLQDHKDLRGLAADSIAGM